VPKRVGIHKLQNYPHNFLNASILEYKESSKPELFLPDPIHEEMKEDKEQVSDDNEPSKKKAAAAAAAVTCTLGLNEIKYGPKENIENVNLD
jgi:hypothetical protein